MENSQTGRELLGKIQREAEAICGHRLHGFEMDRSSGHIFYQCTVKASKERFYNQIIKHAGRTDTSPKPYLFAKSQNEQLCTSLYFLDSTGGNFPISALSLMTKYRRQTKDPLSLEIFDTNDPLRRLSEAFNRAKSTERG